MIAGGYILRDIRKNAWFALLHLICCMVLASVTLIASDYSWVGLLTFFVAAWSALNPLKTLLEILNSDDPESSKPQG